MTSTLFDVDSVPEHPAKSSPSILVVIGRHLADGWRVLDPFAGVGGIHALTHVHTTGVELQPRWAAAHPRTIVGNALALPFPADTFDAVATSPVYGNRLSDHHDARDGSRRFSYTHCYGEALHPDNAGILQWGDKYRTFHEQAWREVHRVVRPGGRFVLNVKDHPRGGRIQPVVDWHRACILDRCGFTLLAEEQVAAPGLRYGANSAARVDHEAVLVFERGSS